ncbi:MAG TPA: hypothetical protein VK901_14225 [Nitrospiraceae bacterium]|nr:hypothetical protein [Nitrospiraceae bacterium]
MEITRKNRTPGFKAQVALAAILRNTTLEEQAEHFAVHPNWLSERTPQLDSYRRPGI